MRACAAPPAGGVKSVASAEAKRKRAIDPSKSASAGAALVTGVGVGAVVPSASEETAYCCSAHPPLPSEIATYAKWRPGPSGMVQTAWLEFLLSMVPEVTRH